jgi:protein-tyrosine kinase
MERIREAIKLAKEQGAGVGDFGVGKRRPLPLPSGPENYSTKALAVLKADAKHLENKRIVAHSPSNEMTPAFDILRTSVVQLMSENSWQTIAITSPTPGCGKTVSAINLAMSISRLPKKHVVLLDLDMRRPLIAGYLGIKPKGGLYELLTKELPAEDCMVNLDIADKRLSVIPNLRAINNPAEVIGSNEMSDLLNKLKSGIGNPIIVIDTPPMLLCDDVLALLPKIDCIALCIAEKMSKADEVIACEQHLKAVNYLGLILTKSQELQVHTYY